jgi:hypothetical protein
MPVIISLPVSILVFFPDALLTGNEIALAASQCLRFLSGIERTPQHKFGNAALAARFPRQLLPIISSSR